MIRTDEWQRQTVEQLQTMLLANENVLGLALFGSATSNSNTDPASDLDILLLIKEVSFPEFFPDIKWLGSFGEVYAIQRFENEFHGTIRICFFDFRRLDIIVTTPSRLRQITLSMRNPFWQGVRLLFSRSPEISHYLSQTWQPLTPTFPSQTEFEEMANSFWFKAMLASYKVLRDDRLIASHLALDLVRDCCVMGMIIRDRSTGTNIHHEGGEGNQLVDGWENPLASYSAKDLLGSIERSCIQFDHLAAQWSETYRERRYPLLEWLDYIRSKTNQNHPSPAS